ncbi:MAG: L-threonylcarbamoyladenylate synthase [Thermoplasmata archaeon]
MIPDLEAATRALVHGDLVVYPTDTLLGLGVRADRRDAVARLFAAKRRPDGLPVSVAVSSLEEVEPLARLGERERALLRGALPGPYTFLLPASSDARRRLARGVVGPSGSIGVRIPDHPVARELARVVGPIVATSANRHGDPPCRTILAARRVFGPSVSRYVPARPPPSGSPSTVVDLTGPVPHVVRGG